MNEFKIENFCSEHNSEFKNYYNMLNNPFYISILLICLKNINNERIKNKIYDMIVKNHDFVLDKLNKIDTIISYYKQNNLINKSEIGNFFKYYEIHKKNTNINNHDELLTLFYNLISYNKCISLLKECFYIFSDYRACIYFMTPSINFYETTKKKINNVIINFRDNINTLNQIISKIYIGDKNPWGSIYYSTTYAMFETLIIIKKYFKNPLKKLNIEFIIDKKNNKNIINNLCNKYNELNVKKINYKEINSVSHFILTLKKLGHDLWFVISLVFDTIFEKYKINNLMDSEIIGKEKILYQKMNNNIGLKCFLLTTNGYISNTNLFKNFND